MVLKEKSEICDERDEFGGPARGNRHGISGSKPRRPSQRRRSHWILLGSAWAKVLGVRKTAGVYRIRSNELQLKLFLMREAPESSAPIPTGRQQIRTVADQTPAATSLYLSPPGQPDVWSRRTATPGI